jgi:hypothetical protein
LGSDQSFQATKNGRGDPEINKRDWHHRVNLEKEVNSNIFKKKIKA